MFGLITQYTRGYFSIDDTEMDDKMIKYEVEEENRDRLVEEEEAKDPWFDDDKEYFSKGACNPFETGCNSGSDIDFNMYAPAHQNDT